MLRTRRVENLRHGALTTTAGTGEGSTITATASPHPDIAEKLRSPLGFLVNSETRHTEGANNQISEKLGS